MRSLSHQGHVYRIRLSDVETGGFRLVLLDTDFNHDGEVNSPDLYLLMKVWHSAVATPTPQ